MSSGMSPVGPLWHIQREGSLSLRLDGPEEGLHQLEEALDGGSQRQTRTVFSRMISREKEKALPAPFPYTARSQLWEGGRLFLRFSFNQAADAVQAVFSLQRFIQGGLPAEKEEGKGLKMRLPQWVFFTRSGPQPSEKARRIDCVRQALQNAGYQKTAVVLDLVQRGCGPLSQKKERTLSEVRYSELGNDGSHFSWKNSGVDTAHLKSGLPSWVASLMASQALEESCLSVHNQFVEFLKKHTDMTPNSSPSRVTIQRETKVLWRVRLEAATSFKYPEEDSPLVSCITVAELIVQRTGEEDITVSACEGYDEKVVQTTVVIDPSARDSTVCACDAAAAEIAGSPP